LRGLERFRDLGAGAFVGVSRKAMIGTLTGRKSGAERAAGSAAAAMIAVQRGATIVRVHDVVATRDALNVWKAVHEGDVPAKAEPKPFGSQRFSDD